MGWAAVAVVMICFLGNMAFIYPQNFIDMLKSLRRKCKKNKKEIYRREREERHRREETLEARLRKQERISEKELRDKRRIGKRRSGGFFSNDIF